LPLARFATLPPTTPHKGAQNRKDTKVTFDEMEKEERERIEASLKTLHNFVRFCAGDDYDAIIALRDIEELVCSRILGDIA
jgi:hypothetical protein